ncbi:cytochrome b5 domain-containing protein 1 [Brienomyrus brachyistius]|uniref:cytochrome b5 domain-containing protein 1 n=1 Tax=Brienomyrus brachyistius TaxID=42636 RepID=UPI0020B42665|nr:cytochrome b5 domain-containing protein 1 [Brienomyrus brachyistius]
MTEMHRPKYFTPKEVSLHNTIEDIWVSYLGTVYNLTPLVKEHRGDVLLRPIVECAGKDISHWFDPKTKDVQTHIDPLSGCVKYYTPRGRFIHIPPPCPRTDWANDFGRPWWSDSRYEVGLLSARTFWIRIINMLTYQEQPLEVCCEETVEEILQRYLKYNCHAGSYTWKHDCQALDMTRTLSENGVVDDDEHGDFSPSICLYFNDDLTE